MNRAQRVGGEMPDDISKKIESQEINSSNYKAAIAKLERIAG